MPGNMRVESDGSAYDVALRFIHATPDVLSRVVGTYVQPAVQEVVERDLAPYPPPIGRGVFKALATPKQRRYAMAKIRRGEWTGRTGGLKTRWIVRAIRTQKGAILETGNTSRVARYVVGRNQQRFHQHTRWPTLQGREFEIQAAARTSLRKGYRTEQRLVFRQRAGR